MAFGKHPSIFGRFTPLISGDVSHVSKHCRVCAFVSKARLRLAGELILTMKLIRDLELQRYVFRVVFPEGDANNHSLLEDIVFLPFFKATVAGYQKKSSEAPCSTEPPKRLGIGDLLGMQFPTQLYGDYFHKAMKFSDPVINQPG